jgi:hypothetical protein
MNPATPLAEIRYSVPQIKRMISSMHNQTDAPAGVINVPLREAIATLLCVRRGSVCDVVLLITGSIFYLRVLPPSVASAALQCARTFTPPARLHAIDAESFTFT